MVTVLVFQRKGQTDIKEETFAELAPEKDLDPSIFGKVHPIIEKGFVTVLIPKTFGDWNPDDPHQKLPLEVHHFKKEHIRAKNRSKKLIEIVEKKNRTLSHMDTYFIFLTGTKSKMWHEAHLDMTMFMKGVMRERQLAEIAAKPSLMKLNEGLVSESTPLVRGSQFQYSEMGTTLFALGLSQSKREDQFPKIFLIDIDLDRPDQENDSPSLGGIGRIGGVQEDQTIDLQNLEETAQTTVVNLALLLSNFTLLQRVVIADFQRDEQRSKEINDKIHELQTEINRLFHASLKRDKDKSSKVQQDEEELLNKASVFFSTVSELEQSISQGIYKHHDLTQKIDEEMRTLGIDTTPYLIGQTNLSPVFEPHQKFGDKVKFLFDNLSNDVESSQSTLRNTIDVLRTFLESKQRAASEKQNRSLGMLSIAVAAMGLADAIGNFVIFYFETNDWFRALVGSGITLMILSPIILTLIVFSLRRK